MKQPIRSHLAPLASPAPARRLCFKHTSAVSLPRPPPPSSPFPMASALIFPLRCPERLSTISHGMLKSSAQIFADLCPNFLPKFLHGKNHGRSNHVRKKEQNNLGRKFGQRKNWAFVVSKFGQAFGHSKGEFWQTLPTNFGHSSVEA